MKVPIRQNNINNKLAQEKLEARESWHKLVVKVICWKDGLLDGGVIKITDKITSKEWGTYHRRMIKMNTSYSRQRVLSNLQETKDIIRQNGGFEEELS